MIGDVVPTFLSSFLKYKLLEIVSLNSAISVCMKKSRSSDLKALTVSDVLNDEIIENDEQSMIRQLGCPTFFLTLSAAETMGINRWEDTVDISPPTFG